MKAPGTLLLLVALAACSHESRLHTAMVGLQVSADAFVVFDKTAQAAIVAKATSETEGIAQLATYRAKRTVVVDAFSVAYRAVAIAAVIGEDESRLTNALLFAAEAVRAFDALRGAP